MNIELATKAVELAKANPERFDMMSFASGWYMREEAVIKNGEDFIPPCGTTACFAGWVAYLAAPAGSRVYGSEVTEPGPRAQTRHVESYATKALGITCDQAAALFYLEGLDEVEAAVTYLADNPDAGYETLVDQFGKFVATL